MTVELPKIEEVEITVAAASKDSHAYFHPEVSLVRAGLLYGDKVTLFSLFEDAFYKLRDLIDVDEDGLIDLILTDARKTGAPGIALIEAKLRSYQRLRTKRKRTHAELLDVQRMRKKLQNLVQQLQANRDRILEQTGASALDDLVGTGLVTVHSIDSGTIWERNDNAVLEYLQAVTEHLATGQSYPLLNTTVTSMLAPALAAGNIVPLGEATNRSKRVSLAANLLFRVPAMDSLTGSDILSLRTELAAPLLRFRSAVMQLSRELQDAPWQPGFDREAESIYESKVVPALIDIGEAVESNSWLSELLSASTKALAIPAASVVGMLAAKATAVPSVLVATLSAITSGGIVANETIRRWKAAQAAVRRNQLFYYWKLLQR